MTIILSTAIVVFGALLFLLLGSQVELFRSIQQLREVGGLIDKPLPIQLKRAVGDLPSDHGLPAPLDERSGVVLFLSDKCGTCRSIAASLGMEGVPADLWLVLDPATPGADPDLALAYQFDQDKVTVDHERVVSKTLGIEVTPAAVIVQDGRVARATSVPSTRQLHSMLESLHAPRPVDIGLQPSTDVKEAS